MVAFQPDPNGHAVQKPGRAGEDRPGRHNARARNDFLRHPVADSRADVPAAAAVPDRGEAGLQDVRRVARGLQRVQLDALLELVLPDVGLVAVIGEMRMAVDQARHKGEPRDVDNPSVAAVFDPPARSRRVNLALLHDNAGIRDGLAARAVDQGPAD
jgi:hypothetical protein